MNSNSTPLRINKLNTLHAASGCDKNPKHDRFLQTRKKAGALALVLFFALVCTVVLTGQAIAATTTNTNANGTTWDTSNVNWSGSIGTTPWDSVNGLTNTAVFTNTSGSISVAESGIWVNGITYNPVGNFTVSGGQINFPAANNVGYNINTASAGGSMTIGSTLSNVNNNKLIKVGGGTLTLNGSGSRLSQVTTTGGTLNVSGGSLTVTNNFFVGEGANVTVNLSGGTFNNTGGTFIVGWGSNSVSTLNVSGGTNNVVNLLVGRGGNNSTTTVSGGELNVATLTMGSVTNNGATAYTNDLNITGGSFTVTNAIAIIGTVATNSTSTITLSGGRTTFRNGLNITAAKASGATANMVFDGGELLSGSTTASFLAGLNSAALTTNGAVFNPNGFSITVAQVLSDAVGQAGKLTLNGSGTLTLSGANAYTGATTISNGTLAVTNGSAITDTAAVTLVNASAAALAVNTSETIGSLRGGGTTGGNVSIASGQVLTVAESGSQTYGGVISGAGSLTKSGNGTLTLTGANTYAGGTAINGGTMVLDGGANRLNIASSVYIASGSTLDLLTNNQTLAGLTGNGTVTSTTNALSLNVATNVNNVFNGSLNVSAFNKQGDGTLTFDGGSGTLGGNSQSQFKLQRGQVNLVSGTLTTPNGLWIADGTGSTGKLLLSGGTINQATTNALIVGYGAGSAGQLEVTEGTLNGLQLRVGLNSGATGTVLQSGGTVNLATLDMAAGVVTATNLTASYTITGGSLNVTNAIISLAARTNSAATLTLSGGTTTFVNGLANTAMPSGATAVMNFDGGELRAGSSRANFLQGLTSANLTANGAVINPNGYNITVAQDLQDADGQSGRLIVNGGGTLTLSGANTYTGGTLVSAGTLRGSVASLRGSITNSSTLVFDQASTGNFNGSLHGNGTTRKTGVGALTITTNSINTFSGNTFIEAGSLIVNGELSGTTTISTGGTLGGSGSLDSVVVSSGGILAPGNSPGLLTISSLTLNPGSSIDFELSDFIGDRGTGWDAIDVGTLTFSSLTPSTLYSINISNFGTLANFTAGEKYSFAFIASANEIADISGLFSLNTSGFNAPEGAAGYNWTISQGQFGADNAIYLNYAVPEPSTYALLTLGAAGLAGHVIRRRYRRRS